MRGRADARGACDREADVAVTCHLRIARVQAHADLDLNAVRPGMLRKRTLSVRRRRDCVTRARECDEEGLSLTVDDDAVVLGERLLQEATMFCDNVVVALTEAMLELGGRLDVGKQKADRAAGKFAHTAIVAR